MNDARDLRLFLDRTSISKRFTQALRDMGADVLTINDLYGAKPAENVQDAQWLAAATADARICVGADANILSNELEVTAVLDCAARYFVFSNNNLGAREQIERFRRLMPDMLPLVDKPGPWVHKLTAGGLLEVPEKELRKRLAARRQRRE
jgi:hypothetical protein